MILNYNDTGSGPVIVFLHGMAGSRRYWNNFIPYISKTNRAIAIDLLGFGKSPKPSDSSYDYEAHIRAIELTLAQAGVNQSFTLVGHSMGALIALRYAATRPDDIKQLALAGMPIYENALDARNSITRGSKLKSLVYYGITSRILCNIWCRYMRPISRRMAHRYLPHLTADSAEDSVLHSWRSYSRSLANIIEKQQVGKDISAIKCPTLLLYGTHDKPRCSLKLWDFIVRHASVRVITEAGTHQIVHEHPKILAKWLVS